jgi:hypothetical protein
MEFSSAAPFRRTMAAVPGITLARGDPHLLKAGQLLRQNVGWRVELPALKSGRIEKGNGS